MRLTRRSFLHSFVQTGALLAIGCSEKEEKHRDVWLQPFEEAPRGEKRTHHLSPDWQDRLVLRWGDPIFDGAPEWRPGTPDPEGQEQQFGYNNDYLAIFEAGRGRALLVANHEYTDPRMMFEPRYLGTPECLRHEMVAQGLSVVELVEAPEGFVPVPGARTRRITATTAIDLAGPAAGSPRLATRGDPDATQVHGTFGNCAGGVTPWGTVLSCEENFQFYFRGGSSSDPSTRRYRLGSGRVGWHALDPRFDLDREPNEANRFGWVVEVDPKSPDRPPVKRTALGRLAHESAEMILAPDGRVVVYLGDDAAGEYLYRFVSESPYTGQEPDEAGALLDRGTLSVARFHPDGELHWLPLLAGRDELLPSLGFAAQADVMIDTRLAASLRGATPLDRPEDVQPLGDSVWVVLTGNRHRQPGGAPAFSVVPFARMGQILRLRAPDGDHTAERFYWESLMNGGDGWSGSGGFAGPDNLAHDPAGNLWVATDQGGRKAETGEEDGLYLWDPAEERGRALFRGPRGSEICGPCPGPGGSGLWLAIQHPGAGGSWDAPSSRWPDFDPSHPPRPSVMELRPKL